MEEKIKDFVNSYFEVNQDKDYLEYNIDGSDIVAHRDRLHNDEYFTARWFDGERSLEYVW